VSEVEQDHQSELGEISESLRQVEADLLVMAERCAACLASVREALNELRVS
jgi:hypothetical protein